jgi:hypothetical protein
MLLLAVVIVIALGVVSLLGFFQGTTGETQANEAQAYWSGMASPIRVTSAMYLSPEQQVCAYTVGNARGVRLVIQNVMPDSAIHLTNMNLSHETRTGTGTYNFFCKRGEAAAATKDISLDTGQTAVIDVSTTSGNTALCGEGMKQVEFNVTFKYNTNYADGLLQRGSKNLVLKCQ